MESEGQMMDLLREIAREIDVLIDRAKEDQKKKPKEKLEKNPNAPTMWA